MVMIEARAMQGSWRRVAHPGNPMLAPHTDSKRVRTYAPVALEGRRRRHFIDGDAGRLVGVAAICRIGVWIPSANDRGSDDHGAVLLSVVSGIHPSCVSTYIAGTPSGC